MSRDEEQGAWLCLRETAQRDWLDENGHVNVQFYFRLIAHAIYEWMERTSWPVQVPPPRWLTWWLPFATESISGVVSCASWIVSSEASSGLETLPIADETCRSSSQAWSAVSDSRACLGELLYSLVSAGVDLASIAMLFPLVCLLEEP